jgi:hypothetical protein
MKGVALPVPNMRSAWIDHAITTRVHPENFARNPQKYVDQFVREYARLQARRAVKRGLLVKPSACSACGTALPAKRLHGHHPDYDYPLEVEWLCNTCHYAKHRGRFFLGR